ncbi:hypothetical protein FOZ63_018635 [Perkinsus olseni]|uniref:Rab-GAP TBC domain-containing protein n=1 Tax=Perkinsus olseni TaxID=32597 RepID=A0A7J6T0M6_PEROL|nr:hypothetical protein FOZ62_028120 [Perkinsus olseni]KAF4752972.1 hypothetical protein FOZ63_018635 [Perkinsus olseni]
MPVEEGYHEEGRSAGTSLPGNAAAIDLDLERTFSHLSSAAAGRGEAKILLNRFVEEHPSVGYTQGMNYVATCLVLRHTREGHCAREVAYQQFVAIMGHLSGLWSDGLPLLEPAIDCYSKCCRKYLPRLYARLVYLHVEPLAYLPTGWLSLFSKWLPMDCVLLVLDLVAGHGLHALLAVTLAIFHQYQDMMVQMKTMHQVLNFINRDMQIQPIEADKLISSTTMVWLPRVQRTVGREVDAAVGEACVPSVRETSSSSSTPGHRCTVEDVELSASAGSSRSAGSTGLPAGEGEEPSRPPPSSTGARAADGEIWSPTAPHSKPYTPDLVSPMANGTACSDRHRTFINKQDSVDQHPTDGGSRAAKVPLALVRDEDWRIPQEIERLRAQVADRDETIRSLRAEMRILKQERRDAIEMQMKCVRAKDELQRQLLGEIADLRIGACLCWMGKCLINRYKLSLCPLPLEWSELPPLVEDSPLCYHAVAASGGESKGCPCRIMREEDALELVRGGDVSTAAIGVVAACCQGEVPNTKARLESLARVCGAGLTRHVEALILTDRPLPPSAEAVEVWERRVGPVGVLEPEEAPPEPTMLILCGLPCSGKSTMSQRYLVPVGYVRVCQDVLKSKDKTLKEVERLLKEDENIVIDRTNADKAQRAPFIALAKRYGVRVCVCVLDTERETCRTRLKEREVHEGKQLTASQKNSLLIGLGMMAKRWEAPGLEEGIDDIRVASTIDEVEVLGKHYQGALCRKHTEEKTSDKLGSPQPKRRKTLRNYPGRSCVHINWVFGGIFPGLHLRQGKTPNLLRGMRGGLRGGGS